MKYKEFIDKERHISKRFKKYGQRTLRCEKVLVWNKSLVFFRRGGGGCHKIWKVTACVGSKGEFLLGKMWGAIRDKGQLLVRLIWFLIMDIGHRKFFMKCLLSVKNNLWQFFFQKEIMPNPEKFQKLYNYDIKYDIKYLTFEWTCFVPYPWYHL